MARGGNPAVRTEQRAAKARGAARARGCHSGWGGWLRAGRWGRVGASSSGRAVVAGGTARATALQSAIRRRETRAERSREAKLTVRSACSTAGRPRAGGAYYAPPSSGQCDHQCVTASRNVDARATSTTEDGAACWIFTTTGTDDAGRALRERTIRRRPAGRRDNARAQARAARRAAGASRCRGAGVEARGLEPFGPHLSSEPYRYSTLYRHGRTCQYIDRSRGQSRELRAQRSRHAGAIATAIAAGAAPALRRSGQRAPAGRRA